MMLVYNPPYCSAESLNKLTKVVLGVVLEEPGIVVLGDFNIHVEDFSDLAQEFMVLQHLC